MVVKEKRRLKATSTRKKKQQVRDRQIDDRDWAGLADYLLELVIERLPLVDCLSFSSVCMGWESVTTKLFERSSRGIPLLVKPGQNESITRTCLNVLHKNKKTSLDILMSEYIGSYIWGSYRDWLILVSPFNKCNVHITLLNPFSGEKVVLPKTPDRYHMLVLSSVPSDPRCIYMLVGQNKTVAIWTLGAQDCREYGFMGSGEVVDALYHEGHFYLLKCSYEMVIIDEKNVINMLDTDSSYSSWITTQYLELKGPCLEISGDTRKTLVESSGDILLVCHTFDEHSEVTCGFETFKLDVSGSAWVKLESLGNDKIIFLGRSCSRSFNTNELLGVGDDVLANLIYFSNNCFTHAVNEWNPWCKNALGRNVDYVDDWGVISLHKENSVWPRAFRKRAKNWAGFWVTAPIWWCLRQQRLKHH